MTFILLILSLAGYYKPSPTIKPVPYYEPITARVKLHLLSFNSSPVIASNALPEVS